MAGKSRLEEAPRLEPELVLGTHRSSIARHRRDTVMGTAAAVAAGIAAAAVGTRNWEGVGSSCTHSWCGFGV